MTLTQRLIKILQGQMIPTRDKAESLADEILTAIRTEVEGIRYKRDWEDEPIGALYGFQKAAKEMLEKLK